MKITKTNSSNCSKCALCNEEFQPKEKKITVSIEKKSEHYHILCIETFLQSQEVLAAKEENKESLK